MMYTTAAFAMILPLLDLHCGKKACDLTEQTFKAENNKFSKYNNTFKSYNSTFNTKIGELDTKISNLAAPAGGIADNTDLTAVKKDLITGGNNTTKQAIADVKKDLITGGNNTTKQAIADVKGAIDNLKASKKYVKVQATFSSTGTAALLDKTVSHKCKPQTTPTDTTVAEDVLCCPLNLSSAITTFRNAKYTPQSVTNSWDLADKLCSMHGMQLCNLSHLSKLTGSAQSIGAILAWGAGVPDSLREHSTLAASGTSAVFVWTSIEC